jgi:hypothetical protein
MLMNASTIATISDCVAFFTIPRLPSVGWLSDGAPYRSFDLFTEQLELTRRGCEPVAVAHHSTSVDEDDERVLAVEQSVDLIEEINDVCAEGFPKCHGSEFSVRNLSNLWRGARLFRSAHGVLATRA